MFRFPKSTHSFMSHNIAVSHSVRFRPPFFLRGHSVVLMLLIASLVLASCTSGSTEDLVPTRAPAPTFTPTPEGAQAPAPQPAPAEPQGDTEPAAPDAPAEGEAPADGDATSDGASDDDAVVVLDPVTDTTDTEGDTADPAADEQPSTGATQAEAIVSIQLLNVRSGPGVNYNILGGINQGERYPITGRNELGDWWQIDYNGQSGWVFDELVTVENAGNVSVAANIPTPPPATPTSPPPPPTSPPPPTNTPAPVAEAPAPEAPAPAPAPESNLPFQLLSGVERCEPNAGSTYFSGYVRYKDNSPRNAVCIHLHFYEPRTTKCSGCDGVGDGVWGFSPFGGPAPAGTPVEIWVVECPDSIPLGGQSSGFGDLTPLSPKWTRTIGESEQCTGITFVGG